MKTKTSLLVSVLALLFLAYNCSRLTVEAGNVGIKVHLYGGEKGVDTELLPVGRYWLGWNEVGHLFPISMQNIRWTEASTDFSPNDEAIRFNDKNGLQLRVDVGISYRVEQEKVLAIFKRHRKGINEITSVYIRNIIQSEFNKASSEMTYEKINGPKKEAFLAKVIKSVREILKPEGFEIERVTLLGGISAPKEVMDALNTKMATQQEAKAIRDKAEAEKYAAEQKKGITQAMIEYEKVMNERLAIKNWNGKPPETLVLGQGSGNWLLKSLPSSK